MKLFLSSSDIFDTGSYVTVFTPKRYVDEDDFEPLILLPLPPKH